MARVYRISEDGKTLAMNQVRCRDEEKELQLLLSSNLDLLPGDQIDPDDPRRWMLIRREMPVEDPVTGGARWSIDFFLVDQDGTPTFVECKRHDNTRSRREVIGQMLEYAANGQYYWTATHLYEHAEQENADLDSELHRLQPANAETVEELLESVENNLREGQIRLVFFLEEAPFELRSIVEFLNRQMERTEVLIVEARQYELDGHRVVAPQLFGYTEEARRIKKSVQVVSGRRRGRWTESEFLEDAKTRLGEVNGSHIQRVYEFLKGHRSLQLLGGTGKTRGSFLVSCPQLQEKSILVLDAKGRIWVYLGYLVDDPKLEEFRSRLVQAFEEAGVWLPSDPSALFPGLKVEDWGPRTSQLIEALGRLFDSVGERAERVLAD